MDVIFASRNHPPITAGALLLRSRKTHTRFKDIETMKHTNYLLTTLLLLTAAGPLAAAPALPGLKVPTYFSDHMILQREKPVPVWGWASAGAKVTVKFAGQEQIATTGNDGRWTVKLTSLTANAKGQALTITEGQNTLEIKDVLVGEVWVCSGQSNMAYAMFRAGYQPKSDPNSKKKRRNRGPAKGVPEGFDPSKYPLIRQFAASKAKNPRGVDPVKVGTWSGCGVYRC